MTLGEEAAALRAAYEQLQTLEIILEYGPLRAYREHGIAQRIWQHTVEPAVTLVQSTQTRIAPGRYEVSAPSPWHAYFYLRAQQQHVYRSGRPMSRAVSVEDPPVGEHMVFRGQRCSSWDFTSSLTRRDTLGKATAERAVEALAEYFKFFVLDEDIRRNTALCFAQHYGIPTSYADVTCDPDIGVWFASHPSSMTCPNEGSVGVVRALTWAAQEHGAPVRVLLAPPFVRNVYLQRGLFIDTTGTAGAIRGTLSLDVTFPIEVAGAEFEVIRNGQPLDIWPDVDEAEQELVLWAEAIAGETESVTGAAEVGQVRRRGEGAPRFWLEKELHDFDAHFESWASMLDWVLPATCVTAVPSGPEMDQPMRYEVLEAKVRSLVSANASFFRAFTLAAEGAQFPGYFEVLRQVLRVAADQLDLEVSL